MIIKDATGKDIEVFTPQEVETKVKEGETKAIEKYKQENPDKTNEVNELQLKLKTAENELETALNASGGKDTQQIIRLRQERDDAKKEYTEGIGSLKKELDTFKAAILGDIQGDLLKKMSRGDVEMEKKIKLEFDNYRPTDSTPSGIQERMLKAYQLVTGTKPTPGFLDGINQGNRGDSNFSGMSPTQKREPSANEKKMGTLLGVTDKDREWYETVFLKNQK